MAKIDEFRSKLTGGGARPSQFKVALDFPSWVGASEAKKTSEFLVKAATLPASIITPIDTPFRGRIAKLPGERQFENWQVTVINDNDFMIRNALEKWSSGVLNYSATNGRVKPSDYVIDMYVFQLDRNDQPMHTYKFHNCFPQMISPIQLDFGMMNNIEEYQVEFSVDYFDSLSNFNGVSITA